MRRNTIITALIVFILAGSGAYFVSGLVLEMRRVEKRPHLSDQANGQSAARLQPDASTPPHDALNVPTAFAGMPLTSLLTGAEATDNLRRLHGRDLGLIDPWVASYHGDAGMAMIWAGKTPTESESQALIDRMVARINQGGTPFTKTEREETEGLTIFTTTGPEGNFHYFFRRGSATYWVSVPPERGTNDMQGLLAKIRE